MSTLATDAKVDDGLSHLDPGLVEMARAFVDSLIPVPEGKAVQRARLVAGKAIFQSASLEMSGGKKFTYEWVEGTTRDQDGTQGNGSTANPLTGLNHYWFEQAAQAIKKVCPINVRKGYPEPTATQFEQGTAALVKWITAAQAMPDIRLDAEGELLRNRSWVNVPNYDGKPWLRTKITDRIKPRSAAVYVDKDKIIGQHLGCEGGIHFRHTSVPSNNAVFCSGCGLRIIVDARISNYQELNDAWCSPRSVLDS